MNTPTPAQALGEVMALSDAATSGEWTVEPSGENEYGVAVFAIHAHEARIHCLAEFYGDEHDANIANAAVNFIRQHGQYFAGLEKELSDALHEISCCDDVRLNVPLAQSIGELQRHRELVESERNGYRHALAAWQAKAEAAEARVREAEGLLREMLGSGVWFPTALEFDSPEGEDMKDRIAAFLAARDNGHD